MNPYFFASDSLVAGSIQRVIVGNSKAAAVSCRLEMDDLFSKNALSWSFIKNAIKITNKIDKTANFDNLFANDTFFLVILCWLVAKH